MIRISLMGHQAAWEVRQKGVFVCALLGALFLVSGPSQTGGVVSSEVHFADASESGLSIIPASCPSTPDYAGECDNPPTPEGCAISASSFSINAGQSTTLVWRSNVSGGYGHYIGATVGQTPPGAVSANGSMSVSPTSNVTYVMSVAYQSSDKNGTYTGYHYCDATITVNAAPSCPSGQTRFNGSCVCTNGLNITTYPSCTCPVGYSQQGSICVQASCPNGLNIVMYPSCTCPAGQVQSGSICIMPSPCPNGLNEFLYPSCTCPAGQVQSGSVCVALCTPTYFCQGNDRYYRNAQCVESFAEACAYGCAGSACLPAPSANGNITATPMLVRSGRTTIISWSVTNALAGSCTVTENNPTINDSWTGTSGTQTSSAIRQRTTYTLHCTGVNNDPFTDSVVVNVIPTFLEE